MRKLLLIIVAIFSLTACHDVDPDVAPSLTLRVTYPNGRPYPYADVDLYQSRVDYEQQRNPVVTGRTDADGRIDFIDLYDIVYYFEVYDNDNGYDNYYPGAVFSTVSPLEYNSNTRFTVQLYPKY